MASARQPTEEVAFGCVVFFATWYVGRRLCLGSERADRLLREKHEEAERIVAQQRARIARELHGVVAGQRPPTLSRSGLRPPVRVSASVHERHVEPASPGAS